MEIYEVKLCQRHLSDWGDLLQKLSSQSFYNGHKVKKILNKRNSIYEHWLFSQSSILHYKKNFRRLLQIFDSESEKWYTFIFASEFSPYLLYGIFWQKLVWKRFVKLISLDICKKVLQHFFKGYQSKFNCMTNVFRATIPFKIKHSVHIIRM